MPLDLTKDKCPITFVKIKVALEKLGKQKSLNVNINEEEDLESIVNSLREIGFQVISRQKFEKGIIGLVIKKLIN